MGLERLTAVLNQKVNNYETDLYFNLINEIQDLAKIKVNKKNISSLGPISDHIKSVLLMTEGIIPSTRAEVSERSIRRASLHCYKLNENKIILSRLLKKVIDEYSDIYLNLSEAFNFYTKKLQIEENKFSETLSNGLQLLKKEINSIKGDELSPTVAFKLYDIWFF